MVSSNVHRPQWIVWLTLAMRCWFVAWVGSYSAAADEELARGDFFERHVRPILVQHCLECHGPETQEQGLRLDSRTAMLRGGERGPALVAGDASASLLLQAVRREGELKMPPAAPLPATSVAALQHWIHAGAVWPQDHPPAFPGDSDDARLARLQALRATHWAFQPLQTREVPQESNSPDGKAVSQGALVIDQLVRQRVHEQGLSPSPVADRRTLIRRLFFDLLGLPPTAEEVRAFVDDPTADAYEQLVDRLLARRQYGERWARHWLDVARYADTTGYQEGAERRYPFAWTYRDYVVRALNEDLPFDEFIIDQLAADQRNLPANQAWRLAAMGFLTLGPRFNYVRHEIIDDRIDVVTRGLLGLTVTCARCHDHKYDPIVAEDYYSLYGIFASSREPLYTDLPRIGLHQGNFARYREFRRKLAQATRSFEQFHQRIHDRIQHETRAFVADYLRYLVQQTPEHRTVVQPRLETERCVIRGPTPYGPGTIVRWQHYLETRGHDDPVFGLWNRAIALSRDELPERWPSLLAQQPKTNPLLKEVLNRANPTSMVEIAGVYGELLEQTYAEWTTYVAQHPHADAFADAAQEQLRQVLYGRDSPLVMNEVEAHDCYTSAEFDQYMPKKRALDSLFREYRDVAAPRAMVMVDRPHPHAARVFQRGQAMKPGAFVSRRFLRAFPELTDAAAYDEGSGRRQLARALVHPDNPLTPRVIVNRVWHWHFGRGLVDTPSDFGTRAAPPTHPKLLDWLAADFAAHGWSLKRLHKQILISATWKQASEASPQAKERDPDNRWLSHMNRRRLGFEALRDSLLLVAGRLQWEAGGPPVEELDAPRRSLYLLVNRDDLHDVFATFDFPSPDLSLARRSETTVPQQALFLMNSDFMTSITNGVLRRIQLQASAADLEERMQWLYRRILTREMTDEEMAMVKETLSLPGDPSEQHDALHDLAQVLLMSNEFQFVD